MTSDPLLSADREREALRAVLRDFDREPTETYLDEALRIFRAALSSPETTPAGGTTTDCPLEGVHEHAFRGPHRFHEWDPANFAALPQPGEPE